MNSYNVHKFKLIVKLQKKKQVYILLNLKCTSLKMSIWQLLFMLFDTKWLIFSNYITFTKLILSDRLYIIRYNNVPYCLFLDQVKLALLVNLDNQDPSVQRVNQAPRGHQVPRVPPGRQEPMGLQEVQDIRDHRVISAPPVRLAIPGEPASLDRQDSLDSRDWPGVVDFQVPLAPPATKALRDCLDKLESTVSDRCFICNSV